MTFLKANIYNRAMIIPSRIKTLMRAITATTSLGRYKLRPRSFPFLLQIQITKQCNLKCTYCYRDGENIAQVADLTLADYEILLDQAKALGTRWVRLLGGEPLIRKDLGAMIRAARSRGLFCELNTNGYLIKQRLDDLVALDSIAISIDGTRHTHDRVRGKGSWQKAIDAIDPAMSLGIPVRLHGCMTRYHSEKDIDALAEIAITKGVAFNFSAPSPTVLAQDDRMSDHPEPKLAARLHSYAMNLKAKGYPVTNTNRGTASVNNWPQDKSDTIYISDTIGNRNAVVPCYAGKLYCTVDVDGSVYTCPALWKSGLDWRKVGLKTAFANEGLRKKTGCISCNYIANLELNLLLTLDFSMLLQVGTYVLGGLLGRQASPKKGRKRQPNLVQIRATSTPSKPID